MKLKNILATTILIAGSYAGLNAQNTPKLDSTKVKQEIVQDVGEYGSLRNESSVTKEGFTREVLRLKTDKFSMDYATYPQKINSDVLQMNLSLPKGFSAGFVKLDQGDNDQHILSLNKQTKIGNWSTNISYGKGLDNDEYQWLIGSADNGKFYFLAATINEGPIFKDEKFEKLFSAAASVTLEDFYLGIGVQGFDEKLKPRGAIAYENDNFGSATLLMYNPNNKGWFFKSQNAVGNISEFVYQRDTYNKYFLAENTAGPFIPHRLSTSVTKGDYTLMFSGYGDDKEANFTVMPGMKTPVVDFGVGVSTHTKEGKTQANASIAANKNFTITDGLEGYVDIQYDAQHQTFEAHTKITYTLTK